MVTLRLEEINDSGCILVFQTKPSETQTNDMPTMDLGTSTSGILT